MLNFLYKSCKKLAEKARLTTRETLRNVYAKMDIVGAAL